MTKWILISGGVLAGVAVLVGAFGAHSLQSVLGEKPLGWIETGVRYQSTHAIAIIACGLLPAGSGINRTAGLFCAGVIAFSGSLYIMALTGLTSLGIVTPVGGVLLVCGWISFCWSVVKLPSDTA